MDLASVGVFKVSLPFSDAVWFCRDADLGLILALPLTSCVTWGKLVNISEPQFPSLSNGRKSACRAVGDIARDLEQVACTWWGIRKLLLFCYYHGVCLWVRPWKSQYTFPSGKITLEDLFQNFNGRKM